MRKPRPFHLTRLRSLAPLSPEDTLRRLRYVASHPDLIQRFGTLPSGGELHWYATGKAEGRGVTFDAKAYLGRTPAASAACGVNLLCATRHYIAAARTG